MSSGVRGVCDELAMQCMTVMRELDLYWKRYDCNGNVGLPQKICRKTCRSLSGKQQEKKALDD